MELYGETTLRIARLLTRRYSSSFSMASRLFSKDIQAHIYAVYGLVRMADEIVDTYRGREQVRLLDALEVETYAAIGRQFSANPIVHAFARTAQRYGIGEELITPFFASMRTDIDARSFSAQEYERYIYGSAEAVGLMCLKIFVDGDAARYDELAPGAKRLGAAYQKVNFLRDMAADYQELGRFYFPDVTFENFDDTAKAAVVADIRADFQAALPYIDTLPANARPAVRASYRYYWMLLDKLDKAPAAVIKQKRLRLPAYHKALLLAGQLARGRR